jgi:hypothetical protein
MDLEQELWNPERETVGRGARGRVPATAGVVRRNRWKMDATLESVKSWGANTIRKRTSALGSAGTVNGFRSAFRRLEASALIVG